MLCANIFVCLKSLFFVITKFRFDLLKKCLGKWISLIHEIINSEHNPIKDNPIWMKIKKLKMITMTISINHLHCRYFFVTLEAFINSNFSKFLQKKKIYNNKYFEITISKFLIYLNTFYLFPAPGLGLLSSLFAFSLKFCSLFLYIFISSLQTVIFSLSPVTLGAVS